MLSTPLGGKPAPNSKLRPPRTHHLACVCLCAACTAACSQQTLKPPCMPCSMYPTNWPAQPSLPTNQPATQHCICCSTNKGKRARACRNIRRSSQNRRASVHLTTHKVTHTHATQPSKHTTLTHTVCGAHTHEIAQGRTKTPTACTPYTHSQLAIVGASPRLTHHTPTPRQHCCQDVEGLEFTP